MWGEGSDEKLEEGAKGPSWETWGLVGVKPLTPFIGLLISLRELSLRFLASLSPLPVPSSPAGHTEVPEEREWGRALVEAGKRLTGGWGQSTGSEELRVLALPTSVMLDCEP